MSEGDREDRVREAHRNVHIADKICKPSGERAVEEDPAARLPPGLCGEPWLVIGHTWRRKLAMSWRKPQA